MLQVPTATATVKEGGTENDGTLARVGLPPDNHCYHVTAKKSGTAGDSTAKALALCAVLGGAPPPSSQAS